TRGYDEVSARRTAARLRDIRVHLIEMAYLSNSRIINDMTSYIDFAEHYHKLSSAHKEKLSDTAYYRWREFVESLSEQIQQIGILLDDVRQERSDFVLEESYATILMSLDSRAKILKNLIEMPAPLSKREIQELQKINSQYARLKEQLSMAS